MGISVKVDGVEETIATLGTLPTIQKGVINDLANVAYELMRQGAGKHSPRINGTGNLYKSLFKQSIPNGVAVGHDLDIAPHAPFVLFFVKAHAIKQKPGGPMLSWIDYGGGQNSTRVGTGKRIFRHSVWHPGYVGDPYHLRAADEAIRQFAQIVDKRITEFWK